MTASVPVTTAPTIGTKAPKKTSTAIGSAIGTPRKKAPSPMPTASIVATSSCVRA